jgi:hypothetical protein
MKPTIYIDMTTETLVKNALTEAHKAFVKNPNATNWDVCVRAMFTHQQLQWAKRSSLVDREKLAFDLDHNPMGEWQNIISRATTGKDIRTAMDGV